jgi:hypothetical protein
MALKVAWIRAYTTQRGPDKGCLHLFGAGVGVVEQGSDLLVDLALRVAAGPLLLVHKHDADLIAATK